MHSRPSSIFKIGCISVVMTVLMVLSFNGCSPAPRYTRSSKVLTKKPSVPSPAIPEPVDSNSFAFVLGSDSVLTTTNDVLEDSSQPEQIAPLEDKSLDTYSETGTAVYYAAKFQGRKTASGERYSAKKYTAAHRTLRFGTKLLVTNLDNNKFVEVRVNDRGPFGGNHLIDLSRIAAKEIGLTVQGVARVKIEVLKAQ